MTVNKIVIPVVQKRGFTLIEMLVVVLIIGILAAVALPQYQKAVIKARFDEAIMNLKTIAVADEACRLGGKEYCNVGDLDIDVGVPSYSDDQEFYRETDYFLYGASGAGCGEMASAQYKKEEVCVCYLKSGEIVITQDQDGCVENSSSRNYAQILNLRESNYPECCCC